MTTTSCDQLGEIRRQLRSVKMHHTGVVFGRVVTRWNEEVVELDTWGRTTMSIEEAAGQIAGIRI